MAHGTHAPMQECAQLGIPGGPNVKKELAILAAGLPTHIKAALATVMDEQLEAAMQ